MKKNITLVLFLLMWSNLIFGQKGEIIYTEYEPDSWMFYPREDIPMPIVQLDIDRDGMDDFKFHAEVFWGRMTYLLLERCDEYAQNEDWLLRVPYQLFDENDLAPISGDTIQVGDIIANIDDCWYSGYRFQYNLYWHPIGAVPTIGQDDHIYLSVKKATEDGCCYGWIDANIYFPPENQVDNFYIYLTIYRMAYCTIPNYPLRVGQTDFDWDVEENQNTVVATIHPNPSSGMVIITGEDLKEAVVFNSIGQKVATAKGEGGQLSIDLTKTTSGIYFVSITDKNGKKGMKKVVKR